MPAHQNGSSNGDTRLVEQLAAAALELDDLRAACRRQGQVIDTLTGEAETLRSGAAALEGEIAELRAESARGHEPRREPRDLSSSDAAGSVRLSLALDVGAPAAARAAVGGALRDGVPAAVLADAQLLISELVTNSLLHSGASPGVAVVLEVHRSTTGIRLDVEDAGRGSAVVARPPDLAGGGGFGLNLVHTLSERWGVEHAAAGGTHVWVHLAFPAQP